MLVSQTFCRSIRKLAGDSGLNSVTYSSRDSQKSLQQCLAVDRSKIKISLLKMSLVGLKANDGMLLVLLLRATTLHAQKACTIYD